MDKKDKVRSSPRKAPPDSLPKLCGGDVELGNFIRGRPGTGKDASKAILREVRGISGQDVSGLPSPSPGLIWIDGAAYSVPVTWGESAGGESAEGCKPVNPQDHHRRYLSENGGCIYIDLDHIELCIPEVIDAFDHVAAWHAMLRIARAALLRANENLPAGERIEVLVNNSDGQGNTYGSHMNFLVTRKCWDDIFKRKAHYLQYLASFLTSSIVFTGAGKVRSENGRPAADYQISQRADFFEELWGLQTTYQRPIVNSRDESLCDKTFAWDRKGRMARLHVIFFDNTLCHTACLLKIGTTQLLLAMMEQGLIHPGLLLESPLEALTEWSRDLTFTSRAKMLSRKRYTAVELQMRFAELARRFVDRGGAEGLVPRAAELVELWLWTVEHLSKRNFDALEGCLDWVLKQRALEEASRENGFSWSGPEMKCLDHLYGNLDSSSGIYFALEGSGITVQRVTEERIERFTTHAPEDTRAWLRAEILRRIPAHSILEVNWNEIRFRFSRRDGYGHGYYALPMEDPLAFTRKECLALFENSSSFLTALAALGLAKTDQTGKPVQMEFHQP